MKCRVRGVVQIRQLVGYQVRVGGFGGRKGLVADCGGDAGEGEDGGGVVLRCLLDGGKWEVGKGWSLYVFVPGVEV